MAPFFAEIVKQAQKFDCLKNPIILQLEDLTYRPINGIALILFVLAILHTLSIRKIHQFAVKLNGSSKNPKSPWIQFLFFLSEVEIIFALWAVPLFFAIVTLHGWQIALDYINTRDYTESLFVVIILSLTATRPILHLAEKLIHNTAKLFGGSLSAWWLVLLTLGPLLGSFITEIGAMALCALLLSKQFYEYRPSSKLAYATLGLLFVNISIGGVLTNFASPAVLILSHCWGWSSSDMFIHFGWKAAFGILVSNLLYWACFRKEFRRLSQKKKTLEITQKETNSETKIPSWILLIHVVFIGLIVLVSHYPALVLALYLFFLGFHQATKHHQYPIRIMRPMLVGLFLAGLVIHGGLQGWWVVHLLYNLSANAVLGMTILLAGFNDNAAISYLTTLIPDWGPLYQYAIFTGVVAGGGLTVIANAPNPAGYTILNPHFSGGIRPLKLFLAALAPTLVLYATFYLFGPLF